MSCLASERQTRRRRSGTDGERERETEDEETVKKRKTISRRTAPRRGGFAGRGSCERGDPRRPEASRRARTGVNEGRAAMARGVVGLSRWIHGSTAWSAACTRGTALAEAQDGRTEEAPLNPKEVQRGAALHAAVPESVESTCRAAGLPARFGVTWAGRCPGRAGLRETRGSLPLRAVGRVPAIPGSPTASVARSLPCPEGNPDPRTRRVWSHPPTSAKQAHPPASSLPRARTWCLAVRPNACVPTSPAAAIRGPFTPAVCALASPRQS